MSAFRTDLTRRGILAAAAGSAAALALPQTLTTPALAAAPMMGIHRPSFYRFRLGDFEVTTFLDGAVQRDGPYPIFGGDQKPETVQALLKESFCRRRNSRTRTFPRSSTPAGSWCCSTPATVRAGAARARACSRR